MDRLRDAILASRLVEARQEAEELLDRGNLVHEVLAGLYFAACHHLDGPFDTSSGLFVVYALERVHHELRRLGVLDLAVRGVVTFLAETPKTTNGSLEWKTDVPERPLAELIEQGKLADVATVLLALEDRRREPLVRSQLLDWALHHIGRHGNGLVYVNAFLHAIERGGRTDRMLVAAQAARTLIERDRLSRDSDPDESIPDRSPLPGATSAGQLLTALREFNAASAYAAIDALCRLERHDEAMTVLVVRAEENAGEHFETLLLADAVREVLRLIPEAKRRDALIVVAQRLVKRASGVPLVEGLANGLGEGAKPTPRERERAEDTLLSALLRNHQEPALEAARTLLFDEEGADRVKRRIVRAAVTLAVPDRPHLLLGSLTLLTIAGRVGWPSARASLLRAVFALAAEADT
jgi:hypothetical protein